MEQEFVIYNGQRMIKGWPEKIEAAQLERTYVIGGVARDRGVETGSVPHNHTF
jgi:hypothetical protein